MKSKKVAYLLLAVLGMQGAHQYYLGRWWRGLMIAVPIHGGIWWFAWLNDQAQVSGEPMPLMPLLIILVALLVGTGVLLIDLFTLPRQIERRHWH